MYPPKRSMAIVLTAIAFGFIVAVFKGDGAGVRDSVGNISAPWLLISYFAGTTTRSWRRGLLMGTVACFSALAAFYVTEAFVLDLGEHSMLTDLSLSFRAGHQYFAAAVLSGPVFGTLGGTRTARRHVVTAVVVGALLVGEPPVAFLWMSRQGLGPAESSLVVHYPLLWVGEVLLGLAVAGGLLAWSRRQRDATTA